MKKIIIRVVIGVVVLVIVALLAIFFSLNTIVKKGVETVGPRVTKTDVRLGAAKLSPLSGNGQLSQLFVGNPEGYKTPSAIKVGEIKVGVEPGSVFKDTLVINQVDIQAPEITLEGSLSGNNLSKILANVEAASGSEKTEKAPEPKPAEKPAEKKSEKKFYVKDAVVTGGKVNVSITTPMGARSATVPLPTVHLQNIGSRENGVTAAELSRQILKDLLASATKAVEENMASITKGAQEMLSKGATGEVNKAVESVKGLFKK